MDGNDLSDADAKKAKESLLQTQEILLKYAKMFGDSSNQVKGQWGYDGFVT